MKKLKKCLSLILSIVVVLNTIPFTTISAQAATTIKNVASSFNWSNYDEWIDFKISNKSKIKFTFKSDIEADISLEYDLYDEIFSRSDTKSYTKTVWLDKGEYSIFLFADIPYDSGDNEYNYSLLIQDVTAYSTNIKFETKSKSCSVGSKFKLTPTYSPSGSTPKSVSYSTSNKKVAVVDKNGYVTAKGLGKCNITAKLNNGKTATFTVTVNSKKLYVFKGSTRTAPLINGKTKAKWKSSKKSIASVSGQKFKGCKSGATKYTTTVSKIKYTCYIYVVDYNTLYKKSLAKYKDDLKDPDSLKIYHIYRGYDSDGEPCIVLDCGAKNSFGGMVRSYCNLYAVYNTKNKKFSYSYYTTKYKISLIGEKKIK